MKPQLSSLVRPVDCFRSTKVRNQARDDFITSSLASSSAFLRQLSEWTSSRRRGDPCSMRFHAEWQYPDCKVMKWYDMQTKGSTGFSSIQHWRNLDSQFYHEFLVIQLDDGSACRVERMGDGSRTDAIRRIGCTAYDIIQWFPAEENITKKWSRGSDEMIIQVDFPRSFDLLDVLAICYTMQKKCPRTSVYTLQRYNCYFLCYTILSVLTRRLEQWEAQITSSQVSNIFDKVLDRLPYLEPQNAMEYVLLEVCPQFVPDGPDPLGVILEALRSGIPHRDLSAMRDDVSMVLWQKNLHLAIRKSVLEWVPPLLSTRLDLFYNPLGLIFDNPLVPQISPDPAMLKELHKLSIDVMRTALDRDADRWEWRYQAIKQESRPSIAMRVALAIGSARHPRTLILSAIESLGHRFNKFNASRIHRYPNSHLLRLKPFRKLVWEIEHKPTVALDYDWELGLLASDRWIEGLMRIHSKFHPPGAPSLTKTLDNAFWGSNIDSRSWQNCFTRFVYESIGEYLKLSQHHVMVQSCSLGRVQLSVARFQEHIRGRIQAHAARIEFYKLAAAPVVESEIEVTMSEVWRALPDGFGAKVTRAN